MNNIAMGGVYVEKDDTIKITSDMKDQKVMTWDDIKIEGLKLGKISKIELICTAGDVVSLIIHYYQDAKSGNYNDISETFIPKSFSLQTALRQTHIDWEPKRRKALGLDE